MNLETIFTVKNDDLDRLNPQEAVDFFRELLWAEATAIGIGKNLINVPSAITVADGGVDAEVKDVQISGGQWLIKQDLTRYQIKTGAFSPSKAQNIKSILFKNKSNILRPRVKSCLDKNGTLIIVLFGWDNPEVKDNYLKYKFKEILVAIDPKYDKAKIEIFRQNNLIGFLKNYPSLALKITGRGELKFQTHFSWSQEAEMRKEFIAGQLQKDFIFNIRNELRNIKEAIHIRIYGEPGIGKTKLVLEATRDVDLEPLVIYCDNAKDFKNSSLMNEMLREDNKFFVILVIDECDPDSRSYIWNKFKYIGPRIKIISIYNDFEETSGNISYYDTPPLEKNEISRIIQGYSIPKDQAENYVEYCGGSPRVAHLLGQNLRNNPDDLLKPPDTVNIWDRYIVGMDDPNSQEVQQRRLALRHIALFKRLGYSQTVIREAQAIWKKIECVDPQITWPRFQEIISKLKKQKILQGEYTLYITPKALHVKLWAEWWDIYGNTFDLEKFTEDIPPKLIEWFLEMFKYAAESHIAIGVVKDFLGKDGIFQKTNLLETKLGASFFLALTEADPGEAIICLKKTIGTQTKDELLQFTTGRREVIWSLEKIATWKDLFHEAARLLLILGEAENETYSNNASGVFVGLFSPAPGQVAPTEASPQVRFPILKEALESNSKERRLLALRACDQALESQHFSRTIGDERYGLKRGPQLWIPKTYGEIFDSYRKVWELLREKLDDFPKDEQDQATDILLKRGRHFCLFKSLADMVFETINELIQKPHIDKKKILAAAIQTLRHMGKKMPKSSQKQWIQIKDQLMGSDFSALMKRYVGMDIIEDRYDEKGNRINYAQQQIKKLSLKAFNSKNLLEEELAWLVTNEAKNGYLFGYELGKLDKNFLLLPLLLEAQRKVDENASVFFLGGYFCAIFEKDKEKWDRTLDSLMKDEKLSSWIPEITWRSGMTDYAAQRILKLAQEKIIGVDSFKIFIYGVVLDKISEDIVKEWIEFLLGSSEVSAISIALDLFSFYYVHYSSKRTLPKELTLKLLTHDLLFQKIDIKIRDHSDDYNWAEIGKKFLELYPEKGLGIAEKMLKNFGKDDTLLSRFHSYTEDFLKEISKKYPTEVWKIIKRYLGPPLNSRSYAIKDWMQRFNFFSLIPLKEIWKWVDGNVKKRARYLASFVPTTLFREEGKVCLARELLIRYGKREDVRAALRANFSTEFWSGPASSHYQKKKERLLKFRQEEDNENVIQWIDEYVSQLDEQIRESEIREERNDF